MLFVIYCCTIFCLQFIFAYARNRKIGTFPDIELSTFSSGSSGVRISGHATVARETGAAGGSAGDFNGDGVSDVIVAAPLSTHNSVSYSGAVFIIFGSSTSVFSDIDLSGFVSGSEGVRIFGVNANDWLGHSAVASAGDMNGDGYCDIICSSRHHDPLGRSSAGAAYVIFGHNDSIPYTDISLSSLTSGSVGFKIFGASANDELSDVGGGFDFNDDGFDDIVVSNIGTGNEAYVLFGHNAQFVDVDLATFSFGTTGFQVTNLLNIGTSHTEQQNIDKAGDYNGDGIDDLIVGSASTNSYTGVVCILFGSSVLSSFPDIDMDDFTSSASLGVKITGQAALTDFGFTVGGGGDYNGDGLGDVIISAPWSDLAGTNYGAVYVLFGDASGTYSDISLASFTSGATGFVVLGSAATAATGLGQALGFTEDFNGDGLSDLVIGNGYDDSVGTSSGMVYVIFSDDCGVYEDIDLGSFGSGARGFIIYGSGAGVYLGQWTANGAGDFNNDGYSDLIVGEHYASSFAGAAYILFGSAPPPAITRYVDLARFYAGPDRFQVIGKAAGDKLGTAIAALGDMDGDGVSDFAVSAYHDDPLSRSNAGTVYVIYGNVSFCQQDIDLASFVTGPSTGFLIYGTSGVFGLGAYSVESAGDMNSDGYSDMVVGAELESPFSTNSGAAYVIFGRPSSSTADIDLQGFASGVLGFKVLGPDVGSGQFGANVAGGFDFNSDGYGDVVMAHKGVSGTEAFVLFGHNMSTAFDEIDLRSFTSGTTGFKITNFARGSVVANGLGVQRGGDFNGDGADDIALGWTTYNTNAGLGFVLFGQSSTSSFSDVDLNTFTSGASSGVKILGVPGGSDLGLGIVGGGDYNGDSQSDLMISAPYFDDTLADQGRVYVFFGPNSGTDIDVSTFVFGTAGFYITGSGTGALLGRIIDFVPDFNGDGLDEIIINSVVTSPLGRTEAGISYLIYGKQAASYANIDTASFTDGEEGFRLYGASAGITDGTARPFVVGDIGDVNGDGYGDFAVGYPLADGLSSTRTESGIVYVMLGLGDAFPTSQPSSLPSAIPTTGPTSPSSQPSSQPTAGPTSPSSQPSSQPSSRPSSEPTSSQPSSRPSSEPTLRPSSQPSSRPSSSPTPAPTLPRMCMTTAHLVEATCADYAADDIASYIDDTTCLVKTGVVQKCVDRPTCA